MTKNIQQDNKTELHRTERPRTDLRRTDLLLPAGSLDKLKIAFNYGADAVYMGTPDLSLRSKSELTLDDVVDGVRYAHSIGKKVYLTLNMYSHNKDIKRLPEYIDTIKEISPDGVLIADPGVFQMVKDRAPEIPLHISTQANVCSYETVKFWQSQGAKLCVLAREVTFDELKEIREKCPDIKLEAFVHGTMCMTYSGRCLLSNFLIERGANQGSCANSCRWNYKVHVKMKDGTVKELEINEDNRELFEFYLEEEFRPGELMEITEDEKGSYIMNSKDLCLMPKLNEYLDIGIDVLKIEGRGKSPYYVATTAREYRRAIDDYYKDPENWDYEKYMVGLRSVGNHGFTLAFHDGRLKNFGHNYEDVAVLSNWDFAGIIRETPTGVLGETPVGYEDDDAFYVEVKNKIEEGDVLEFMSPVTGQNMLLRVYEFEVTNLSGGGYNENEIKKVVHGGMKPLVRIPFNLFNNETVDDLRKNFPPYTIIRKERTLTDEEVKRLELDIIASEAELTVDLNAAPPTPKESAIEERYRNKLSQLKEALKNSSRERSAASPRFGIEGCCGRGCNGCMVFWHDKTYEKARELLKTKKIGEMLPGG